MIKKINLEKADKEIVVYIEMLLEKKGMDKLPPEILGDMLVDMYTRFQNFLFLSVMQKMDKDGYRKFDEFVESEPSPEEAQKFLQDNVENLQQVVREAMNEFENVYLGKK